VLELYDAGRPALGDVVLLRHDADDVLVKGTRPPGPVLARDVVLSARPSFPLKTSR
jgi:hypothetical protein